MSQPRVDIYNFPHKGLRNLLSQVSFMAGILIIQISKPWMS